MFLKDNKETMHGKKYLVTFFTKMSGPNNYYARSNLKQC